MKELFFIENFQLSSNKISEIKKMHGIECETQVSQDIEEQILGVIEEYAGNYEKITSKSDFLSLGLDSITFITIIVAIEEKFMFEFDDEMLILTAFPDIEAMIHYVKSKIGR